MSEKITIIPQTIQVGNSTLKAESYDCDIDNKNRITYKSHDLWTPQEVILSFRTIEDMEILLERMGAKVVK